MSETPGQRFYRRQIEYLTTHDVDALVENQYHAEASLVGFQAVVSGREALRSYFRRYLDSIGQIRPVSVDNFAETEDSVFFESTMRTDKGEAKVYNVFVLDGEKATHHFTGVISTKPLEDDHEHPG
jgi:hypothetical protein